MSGLICARQVAETVVYCASQAIIGKGPSLMDKAQVDTHIQALNVKHAAIQARIDDEEHRPHPDDTRLHELKKAKLRVKDVMLGI